MPFTLEEESLLIKGRKGDTGSFTFNFNKDISAYTVHFYVKKNLTDSDDKLVVSKEYANPKTESITVNLTTEDTKKFATVANAYSTYYWGVRINIGTEFAQTVIPLEFNAPPMMLIYPPIGGV